MSFFMEGRSSDSPYIEMVWQGHAGANYAPTCPADVRWNLLFLKHQDRVKVSVEGPLSKAKFKTQAEGVEWLVIKFKLGYFMPRFPMDELLDRDAVLPDAAGQSFWLHDSAWSLPTYQNVETFVDMLVRDGALVRDPIVCSVLDRQSFAVSSRTVRRRFLQATGLTQGSIYQIERALYASSLLGQGMSILDTVDQAGYADQPHLTRSLKRYIGQTPAQLLRLNQVE